MGNLHKFACLADTNLVVNDDFVRSIIPMLTPPEICENCDILHFEKKQLRQHSKFQLDQLARVQADNSSLQRKINQLEATVKRRETRINHFKSKVQDLRAENRNLKRRLRKFEPVKSSTALVPIPKTEANPLLKRQLDKPVEEVSFLGYSQAQHFLDSSATVTTITPPPVEPQQQPLYAYSCSPCENPCSTNQLTFYYNN